ncbi:hypothetical protein HDV06_003407 [Boothiomyces sp. JEL0866]|nr:hypothetical protein HDV06_003359 [Boothiomyces sp. JEL0866]KAJ3325637.1 hypothetical protein HDV06_003407 [Boothiomyces sp. JEL0866]
MSNDCGPAYSLFKSFNLSPTFDNTNTSCCVQTPALSVFCTDSRITGLTIQNCIMQNVTLSWDDLKSASPQLQSLQIPGNGLLGDFHPQLTNLVYLDAGFNNFTGSINPDISNMPNLKYLGVQYTQISGSLPDSLAKLPLTSIDLSSTNVSGQVPNLSSLSLAYCNLGNACTTDSSQLPSACKEVPICGAGQNGSSPSYPPPASISVFTIVIVAIAVGFVAVGVALLVMKKRKGGFVERPWTLQRDDEEERQPITMVEVDDAFELRQVKPLE